MNISLLLWLHTPVCKKIYVAESHFKIIMPNAYFIPENNALAWHWLLHIPKRKHLSVGHRWQHAPAPLLAAGIAPHCLQEWESWDQLLPGWMKGPGSANWARPGVIWRLTSLYLCSTCSAGEWVLCLVFCFPCERCRDVRPTRERLKRCGSLTAGDH